MSKLLPIAENVWRLTYPLSIMGMEIGRNVTIIRLATGDLIIHSTAPFEESDIEEISNLGTPRWLIDSTNFHDTYTAEGAAAFPDLTYLVTEGFNAPENVKTSPLIHQSEWGDEITLLPIMGMPKVNETVLYHPPSKTLVVADLLFNLPQTIDRWTRAAMRGLSGIRPGPAMSRLYRLMIKDEGAFTHSLVPIFDLDFETVVVAHGDPIRNNPAQILPSVLASHGYKP